MRKSSPIPEYSYEKFLNEFKSVLLDEFSSSVGPQNAVVSLVKSDHPYLRLETSDGTAYSEAIMIEDAYADYATRCREVTPTDVAKEYFSTVQIYTHPMEPDAAEM